MTMIINQQPPPPLPPAPVVADRPWLAQADRSLRVVRWVLIFLAAVLIFASLAAAPLTNNASLLIIPSTAVLVIVSEVSIILARSVVAIAWELRKPDGQP